MKKKIIAMIVVLIVLISGGIYMYTEATKFTKLNFGPKTTKLYQHGFRLLEEQKGLYIKEHYSGISKIEFSPIYVDGTDGSFMTNAYVRPTIYDQHGNKATLGTQIKKFIPKSYGIITDIFLSFDGNGNEVIELMDSEDDDIDVSKAQHLPKEAKLSSARSTDLNIKLLIEDGQLEGVVKDEEGSPDAEIIYNVELTKDRD